MLRHSSNFSTQDKNIRSDFSKLTSWPGISVATNKFFFL
jgi:hypothetical protein